MIPKRNHIAGSAGVLLACAAATGQTTDRPAMDDPPNLAGPSTLNFTWTSGIDYQDSTDIDGGGDVSVLRVSTGLGVRMNLAPDFNVTISGGFSLDEYDFDGTAGLAGLDPWDDIYTLNAAAIFDLSLSNDWSLFGGPIMQIANEGSLSTSDAWIGGGMFGATHVVSPDLTLGFGLGVLSQIEDDALFFPIIRVNWELTENLRLANAQSRVGNSLGLELVYDVGRGFDLALGLGYEFRRFRLDGSGVAPDGVGEETRIPGWVRVGYQGTSNVRGDFYAGIALDGEIRLDDNNGNSVISEDYDDPAFFVAAYLRIRF